VRFEWSFRRTAERFAHEEITLSHAARPTKIPPEAFSSAFSVSGPVKIDIKTFEFQKPRPKLFELTN
jgi:hypothetical protein